MDLKSREIYDRLIISVLSHSYLGSASLSSDHSDYYRFITNALSHIAVGWDPFTDPYFVKDLDHRSDSDYIDFVGACSASGLCEFVMQLLHHRSCVSASAALRL